MNLVADETVDKMENKAQRNSNLQSRQKIGKETFGPKEHYKKLRKKRMENLLKQYAVEEKKKMTVYIAQNPNVTLKDYANKQKISVILLKAIMEECCVNCIIDNDTFFKLRARSLKNSSNQETVQQYFDFLEVERKFKNGD